MDKDLKTYDAYGNEIILNEDDFKLTNNQEKISDEKFNTKTTTFARDAFKRFCKNKSSVVGAIIIGILIILSIFVPLFSPYEVSNTTNPEQSKLPPKLFSAGTGFWDGTNKYENQVYDYELEEVAGGSFLNDCIIEKTIELSNITTTNQAVTGAHGGYILLIQDANNIDSLIYQNANKVNISSSDNVILTLDLLSDEVTSSEFGDITLSSYKVYLTGDESQEKIYLNNSYLNSYGVQTFNLSNTLKSNNIETLSNTSICIEVKTLTSSKAYIGIKSLNLSSLNSDSSLLNLSFDDANEQVLLNRLSDGSYPSNYWSATYCLRKVYQANIQYITFRYDEYKAKLGTKTIEISEDDINAWLDAKLFEKEIISVVGEENETKITFKAINVKEDCPLVEGSIVEEVVLQQYLKDENGIWGWKNFTTYKGDVTLYKYKGYSSMPSYIFGTTDKGLDLFTLAFYSLRTSLLLAVVVFAINFTIGVIWGSISGYFGGNVDLVMQRITDILSGVPFIVVITLCILHLGNNVATFGIALCLTGWISTANRTRTQFYRFKGREYVLASRTLGAKDSRLIFKHILPNALGTIVTGAVLMIPSVIFSEATLAYLNLGLQGTASFGVLLSDNQKYLSTYPMLILMPAVIISLLMISFNLFGNGLRDALNPSLKGSD